MCRIAPHVARRPVAHEAARGCGSRALAYAAHGRAEACQRDPHPARSPEERPQSRSLTDSRSAARSAGISPYRESLRSPFGGPEVRAREGEQDSHAVPHLAEQDDRRPVGAAARRAGQLPPALEIFGSALTPKTE